MKITDVHITPVAVADPPLLNAAGLHAPLRPANHRRAGQGMAVSPAGAKIPGSEATRAALQTAAEHIIGLDPWGLNAIAAMLESLANPDERGGHPLGSADLGTRPQRHRSRLLRSDGQVGWASRG